MGGASTKLESKPRVAYEWAANFLEQSPEWMISPRFRIPNLIGYFFNISARLNTPANTISVMVTKNNVPSERYAEACAATITIVIDNHYSMMASTEGWVNNYVFNDAVSISAIRRAYSNSVKIPIKCEIQWYGISHQLPWTDKHKPLHRRNMKNYYMNPEYSDITIEVGTESIPAHKIVLASQSSLFLSYFKASATPTIKTIAINAIDIDIVKTVLRYLYTGDTSSLTDIDILFNVFEVARRFEILKLRNFCIYKLRKSVTIENAVSMFNRAKNLKASCLYTYVLNYIADHEKQMAKRQDFQELCLKDPEIALTIIRMRLDGR